MAGFKGQAAYSVDAKGRVAIPAKMRAALSPEAKNTFTITRGFEKCVFLYPLDHWARMEMEMRELNMYNKESRDFLRTILMWADEMALDGQGRIAIARPLLEFAGITPGGSALIISNPMPGRMWMTTRTWRSVSWDRRDGAGWRHAGCGR
jgi:MraZ protein